MTVRHVWHRRVWSWVVLCAMLVAMTPPSAAQRRSGEIETRVGQAILMEAATGAILFQHNADEPIAPRGLTKLMTLAVAFKLLKDGKLKPADEVEMSRNAWSTGGFGSGMQAMMVPVNRKARIDEILQGIAVWNGNDAAISLAEGVSGSEAKFADLMGEEARRLGLQRSQFKNATGFEAGGHHMSVKDIAILARHIIDTYPEQLGLFTQREFVYRRQTLRNRNPLLAVDSSVDGLMSGSLRRNPRGPKWGLVATAVRGGKRLIVVVNDASSAAQRQGEASRLLAWGFKNIKVFKLFDAEETVGLARVWGGSVMYVPLVGRGEVSVWLPRYPASQRLRGEIVYTGPLKAPIRKGQAIARLRITSSANATQEVPLYAGQDVSESGLVWRGLDSLAHLALRLMPL